MKKSMKLGLATLVAGSCVLSAQAAVIAAWDFNQSSTTAPGNTSVANGWTAFTIGAGASSTIAISGDDFVGDGDIILTQGTELNWNNRDRIGNTGTAPIAAAPALLTTGLNEMADGFDLNPGPTQSFTLSGLQADAWYRLQFVGGMRSDTNFLRNVTLTVGSTTKNLFTVDTTVYADNTDLAAVSEYLYFKAVDADEVLTFGEVQSGQKIVGGLIVETIPEPATLGMVAVFGAGIMFIRRRFMM